VRKKRRIHLTVLTQLRSELGRRREKYGKKIENEERRER
jgi:hypothetical protein